MTSVWHFVGDLGGGAFGKDQEEMLGQLSSRERGSGGTGDTGDSQGTAWSLGVGWGETQRTVSDTDVQNRQLYFCL